jgi:hypothetical protein
MIVASFIRSSHMQVRAPNPVEMIVTLIRNPAASQLLQQQFTRVAWFRRVMLARVQQVIRCADQLTLLALLIRFVGTTTTGCSS